MRRSLSRRVLVASGLLAVVILVTFGVLIGSIVNLRKDAGSAAHSEAVLAAVSQSEQLLVEIQTGTRGFLLTGDRSFLDPWAAGVRGLPSTLDRLIRLVSDNAAQEARARAIQQEALSYQGYSVRLVQATRLHRDFAAAPRQISDGQQRVDALQASFAGFAAAERNLLAKRSAEAGFAEHLAIGVGAGAVAGSLLILFFLVNFVARSIVAPVRRLAAAAVRLGGGDLSARVSVGGDAEINELARSFNVMAEAVKESQEELDHFFTLSLDLLCITGFDGNVRRLNPAWEATLGYTTEELIGRPLMELVHPDDRARSSAEREKVVSGVEVTAVENRFRCKDGSYRWLLWNAASLPEQGLIYAAARDVTERKLAEVQLAALNAELERHAAELEETNAHLEAQSNELGQALAEAVRLAGILRAVLDATAEGIRMVDLEGRTVIANAAVEAIAEDVFGHPVEGTIYELATAIANQTTDPEGYLAEVLKGVDDPEYEGQHEFTHAADGRTFQRYTAPVRDSSGMLIGRISVLHEVTAERQVQRDLEQAVADLAKQEALKQAVLDAARDGIRLVDLEGRTLLANSAVERITTEVLGLPAASTFAERSATLAERLTDPDAFWKTIETINSDPESETLDEFEVADSGRSFERFTAPVRDSSGTLLGRIFLLREVTAERRAERTKSEVLATVSHELRTPLTGILGFSELLVERKPDQATSERYLKTIHREARRLTALVDDFLDLQRMEEGGLALALEPFELDGLLAEHAEVFSDQSDAHTIDVELPAAPITVIGERGRVAAVVENLLSNAIKYSPAGGSVKLAAEVKDGVARVSVTDSGLGIPADQQGQVFTKFFRVDSSDTREIGGTGLGLALCREIVEAHSGRIGFESVEGEGSTFWFELPVALPRKGAVAA